MSTITIVTLLLLSPSPNGNINGWMDERMNGWMNGWIDGYVDRYMGGCKVGWIDRCMTRWKKT